MIVQARTYTKISVHESYNHFCDINLTDMLNFLLKNSSPTPFIEDPLSKTYA